LRLKGQSAEAKDIAARAQSMRQHTDYAGANSFAAWLLESPEMTSSLSAGSVQYLRAMDNLETLARGLRKVNRPTDAGILDVKAKAMRAELPAARP
jgi:hypothetical protein